MGCGGALKNEKQSKSDEGGGEDGVEKRGGVSLSKVFHFDSRPMAAMLMVRRKPEHFVRSWWPLVLIGSPAEKRRSGQCSVISGKRPIVRIMAIRKNPMRKEGMSL